jgi:hypothetical protein
MMNFTGSVSGSTSQLSWTMENETNSSYFVIERSANGSTWDSIASVAGLNNAHESDYTWSDMDMLSGNNYYRLRQVTMDGISKYSKVISLDNTVTGNKSQMKVFPNPALATLNYTVKSTGNDMVTVQIYNFAGVQMTATQQQLTAGVNQQSIAIASLKAGDYILKITNSQGSFHYAQVFAKL